MMAEQYVIDSTVWFGKDDILLEDETVISLLEKTNQDILDDSCDR